MFILWCFFKISLKTHDLKQNVHPYGICDLWCQQFLLHERGLQLSLYENLTCISRANMVPTLPWTPSLSPRCFNGWEHWEGDGLTTTINIVCCVYNGHWDSSFIQSTTNLCLGDYGIFFWKFRTYILWIKKIIDLSFKLYKSYKRSRWRFSFGFCDHRGPPKCVIYWTYNSACIMNM